MKLFPATVTLLERNDIHLAMISCLFAQVCAANGQVREPARPFTHPEHVGL